MPKNYLFQPTSTVAELRQLVSLHAWLLMSAIDENLENSMHTFSKLLKAYAPPDAQEAGKPVRYTFGLTNMEMSRLLVNISMTAADKAKKHDFIDEDEYDYTVEAFSTMLATTISSVSMLLQYASNALWFEEGMPTIEVGHKLAASLMTTRLTEEVTRDAHLPFHAFSVVLPDNLVFIDTREGICDARYAMLARLRHVISDQYTYGCFIVGSNSMATCLHGHYPTLWDAYTHMGVAFEGDPFQLEMADNDTRNAILGRRLLINISLMMTDPANYKKVGKGHAPYEAGISRSRLRGIERPTKRVFKLIRPVRHDFRDLVRAYARGEAKKLSVQGFIAGHIKYNQPYGPGSTLRKRIWIEPYWRGPEDAPIALPSPRNACCRSSTRSPRHYRVHRATTAQPWRPQPIGW